MSANSILAAAAEAAKTKSDEYVFMAVEQRVLRTIDGVIQISNIDSFGVRDSNNKNGVKGLLIVGAIIFGLAGLVGVASGVGMGLLGILIAILFFIFARKMQNDLYFYISLNGGRTLRFISKDRDFLFGALNFLSEKINSNDLYATKSFNFQNNVVNNIENATVNTKELKANSMTAETVVSGADTVNVSKASNGGVVMSGSSVSGSIVTGDGNAVGAGSNANFSQYVSKVDFGDLPLKMERLRVSIEKSPSLAPQIEKIDEFMALMKSGAPTAPEKNRFRELGHDICAVLQAYPTALGLIQQAMSLVS
ncbi:MAG: hypothetical protein KDJ48_02475 [Nitratireductor sp.]|nr:hypothetical protein [Nitratireductor sp.]